MVAKRILDWFKAHDSNENHKVLSDMVDEIDALIASSPPTQAGLAWKAWAEFEDLPEKHDPGNYISINHCYYTEWCARVELGLTRQEFGFWVPAKFRLTSQT